MSSALPKLWELPDVLLFRIVSFAAAPSHRASIICHQIAPLCRKAHQAMALDRESLWDEVLRQDYGVTTNITSCRRACKRLKRSPIERVRDAHLLVSQNTEIAFFYLSELVNGTSGSKLTKARMVSLLDEYGPHLRINRTVSSGGLFLVEVTRAKNVKEAVVLKCVRELVQQRGALCNLSTNESAQSSMTALCVAAARGMHTVVNCLLGHGASRKCKSSGRFTMYAKPKTTVRCNDKTARQFAVAMRDAEKAAGGSKASLAGLEKCIRLLK